MSSSSKHQKGGHIWSKKKLYSSESSQQEELYQDLSLPLDRFIKCIVQGDLTALIIKGKHSGEKLALAWGIIYSKYLDANYENDSVYPLQLKKEITLLDSYITEVEICLYFISNIYPLRHEGLEECLKGLGHKLKAPYSDAASLNNALFIIRNKLGRKKLDLTTKIKELSLYIEAHKNDEVTDKYFVSILSRLAKYQGVALIRSKDITVQEFITLLSEYLNYYKQKEDGEER